MDPDLKKRYRSAIYRVHTAAGPIDLHIDDACPALLAVVGPSPWAFLTAWNPRSIRRSDDENRTAQAALEAALALAGIPTIAGEGRAPDGGWNEPSVLAIGLPLNEAVALARRFGQAAIVAGTGGSPPALVVVDHPVA